MQVSEKTASSSDRIQTNKSLGAERGKTDAALLQRRKLKSHRRQSSVEEVRRESDRNAKAVRAESDELVAIGTTLEEQLHAERELADQGIALERKHADLAIESARHANERESIAFCAEERLRTDKNLHKERVRIDKVVESAAKLLMEEKSAHEATKENVTTRDEFIAIVSHDLRSPLSVVSMCAEALALRSQGDVLSLQQAKWVDTIRRTAANMNRLILDLLDVEHMASGSLQMTKTPCCFADIMLESVGKFRVLADAAKISLRCNVSLQNPNIEVIADADRIRQVLENILANAVKFTPPGGKVAVSIEILSKELQISVRDSGPGIDASRHQDVFKRFSQIGRSDRTGVGLGLYIAKWIVESHGGRIWVDTEVKQGSRFLFTLPLPTQSETATAR